MLVVAAFESRSETATVFSTDTFNSRNLNITALAEIIGALLLTQWDFLRRLLDTTRLTAQQWGLALLAAMLLLLAWEFGKWIARRSQAASDASDEPAAAA
jgi:Ca2+-transporting ATPase